MAWRGVSSIVSRDLALVGLSGATLDQPRTVHVITCKRESETRARRLPPTASPVDTQLHELSVRTLR